MVSDASRRLEAIRQARSGSQPQGGRLIASQSQEPRSQSGFSRLLGAAINPLVDVPNLPGGFVGDIVEQGVEGLSSPVGIASLLLAPVTGGTSLGLTGALGTAARVGSIALAEAAVGGAAGVAAQEVSERLPAGTPDSVRLGLSLLAGAGAGIGASQVLRSALRGRSAADAMAIIEEQTKSIDEISDPLEKLIWSVKNQHSLIPDGGLREIERGYHESNAESLFKELIERGDSTPEALLGARNALKGEVPVPRFNAPSQIMSKDDFNLLGTQMMKSSKLTKDEKVFGWAALTDVFANGEVPARHELRILETQFGSDLTEAILLHSKNPTLWKQSISAMGLPRAIMASWDLSGFGRQGIVLLGTNPKGYARAIGPALKAWGDETTAKATLQGIIDDPLMPLYRRAGGDITRFGSSLSQTEEYFYAATGLAERGFKNSLAFKGVKASERAYVTFLDKLRFDTWKMMMKNYEGLPENVQYKAARRVARFVNSATGRSQLPKALRGASPLLNAAFFAPRFLYSRFVLPVDIFRLIPHEKVAQIFRAVGDDPKQALSLLRNDPDMKSFFEASRGFAGFALAGMSLVGLSAAAAKAGYLGFDDVELNPKSSDFGKIRQGNTRYDLWAGYQPLVRYATQLAFGEGHSSNTGKDYEAQRGQTLLAFLRSKLAPVPGYGTDLLFGKTIIGEEVTGVDDVTMQAVNRLVPLFVQDLVDNIREDGPVGGTLGILPAFVGASVQTYSNVRDIQNQVSQALYDKDFIALTGTEQLVVNSDPAVMQKEAEWLDTRGDTFASTAQGIDKQRIGIEQALAAQYQSGVLSPQDLADSLGNANIRASAQKAQAIVDFGYEFAPPESPLRAAVSNYYDLYKQADLGFNMGIQTGEIDWEKFDQLEQQYLAGLTDEQRVFVDARLRTQHDPSVQFVYNARDYVSNSGYYDLLDTAFNRYKDQAQRLAGATSMNGLNQVYNLAVLNGDKETARRLEPLIGRIQRYAATQRERLRRTNPELDAMLYSLGRTSTLLTRQSRELAANRLDTY